MTKNGFKKPIFASWLLKRLIDKDTHEALIGDFDEMFQIQSSTFGWQKARRWYWMQIAKVFIPSVFSSIYWRIAMIKNYLKIAVRNIWKYKGYSFINILGLTVSIACCILILLWVRDELSFDRFHQNTKQIYRVTEHQYNSSGDYFPVAVTPWPLAEGLKKDFPEIVESARLRILSNRLISYKDKKFYEKDFVAVDPNFLKMFSFPLIKGDISTALTEPHTILITEETAARYFGSEDPIGKSLTYNNRFDFLVTGVLKNVPQNSHIKFDFLVPFESTLKEFGWSDSWFDNNYTTYVQLERNAAPQQISDKVINYLKKIDSRARTKLIMQPLGDIHLRSDYAIDLYGHTENKSVYVYAFSAIALFVLLIACINFMILSTARSEKRSKEVGLRKVIGANRYNIIAQFYGESMFMTLISFFAALLLVCILLPAFNNLSGKLLTLGSIKEPLFLLGLFWIMMMTGLVSGSYPALVQSSFKPVDSIKGTSLSPSSKSGKLLLRRLLVVVQFTISIILIVGTLIVYKQINFMLNKELGYEKESILYFTKSANLRVKYDAFKSELLRDPNIISVTTSSDIPTYTVHSTGAFFWEGKDPKTSFLIHQFSVDHDYIETFKMNIIAGRDFSKDFPTDGSTKSFIVNETAVKAMGLKNPIGSKFQLYRNKGVIVGVVEDFHFKSLQKDIEPLVLRIEPRRDSYIFVKFKSGYMQEALDAVGRKYKSFNPSYLLKYSFLDEAVEGLYNSEKKTKKIFNYLTIIAIIISCLGLFGLAAYIAQQKTKEIGIRKVLGASIMNIICNLSKEFILLVCIANAIAWLFAYLMMNKWLHNFAYRINIEVSTFILAGFVSIILSLIAVGYQSIKAAMANPVESLKYE